MFTGTSDSRLRLTYDFHGSPAVSNVCGVRESCPTSLVCAIG